MLEIKYMNNVENCVLRFVTRTIKHDVIFFPNVIEFQGIRVE